MSPQELNDKTPAPWRVVSAAFVFWAWYTFIPIALIALERVFGAAGSIPMHEKQLLFTILGPPGWCLALIACQLALYRQEVGAGSLAIAAASVLSWAGLMVIWRGFFVPYAFQLRNTGEDVDLIFPSAVNFAIIVFSFFAVCKGKEFRARNKAT